MDLTAIAPTPTSTIISLKLAISSTHLPLKFRTARQSHSKHTPVFLSTLHAIRAPISCSNTSIANTVCGKNWCMNIARIYGRREGEEAVVTTTRMKIPRTNENSSFRARIVRSYTHRIAAPHPGHTTSTTLGSGTFVEERATRYLLTPSAKPHTSPLPTPPRATNQTYQTLELHSRHMPNACALLALLPRLSGVVGAIGGM